MLIPRCRLARSHPHPHLRHSALLPRSRLSLHIPTNHHGTQTTNSQTKQDAIPHDTTTTNQKPKLSPLEWFRRSQSQRPYTTQLCLTPLIFCVGDFAAQMIGDDDGFDYHRALRSAIAGLVIAIPTYKWFLFLGRRFNYSSPALSLGAKVAVNQTVYTPLFNVYFFAAHGLLAGEGVWGAMERVKDKASISIPRSFLFWPFVTAFNFTYIQPQSRGIATSIGSVFWQTYLSWLNSRGERKGKPSVVEG
ncbi:hypothetical protein N7449_006122 [Penicillium cf. viridicatum]|uniref:Mpv17/PMP22 n=1 Tax=Penicillium cf. viridicatum TaxID=2972119 RepID=A0A9W9SWP7_9EURO|nr:hypothetical protein N7449_006122 [Penicillium cf. viridicatum]